MEIKCQLDATDDFLLQILLLAQHVSGTTMPIIRSSRVLYKWLLPVVFGALVFTLSVWCEAEGYVSGLLPANFHTSPNYHPEYIFDKPQGSPNLLKSFFVAKGAAKKLIQLKNI